MAEERSPAEVAEALRREALHMAIEYHARSAQHPKSRGPAKPTTITATADNFYDWLRTVAERAGYTGDEPLDDTGEPPAAGS